MRWLFLSFFFFSLLAGCTSASSQAKVGSVSGKVTHGGKPLPGGHLTFHPSSGPTTTAQISSDGTFEASGLPLGQIEVSIETDTLKKTISDMESMGFKATDAMPELKVPADFKGKVDNAALDKLKKSANPLKDMKYVSINEKYADPKKSGLTVTVQEGKQEKIFAVD